MALGLMAAQAGCATSPVIKREDPVLDNSEQRLARTEAAVERLQPPPDERRLFMQAEGLYRYRFEPPPRSLANSLAVVAAATTDLPAFQALAGSLDLFDLRLRSYDGAVHLWETLLSRHPQSVLRPLTLYRLGWAYRNAGATGLPRASGTEAFDELAKVAPTSPLTALAAQARQTPSKSKDTATAMSMVPGLGQVYVGEYLSGAVRFTVGLASTAMIVLPVYVAYKRRQDLTWSRDWPLLAVGLGGLIFLSIDYTVSYQDALRSVVEHNDRVEADFEARHPEVP
jgi:hypothetical protein